MSPLYTGHPTFTCLQRTPKTKTKIFWDSFEEFIEFPERFSQNCSKSIFLDTTIQTQSPQTCLYIILLAPSFLRIFVMFWSLVSYLETSRLKFRGGEEYIWEEICWPYKASFWCHIFCIFEHLFRQLIGLLCQNLRHFLKIYERHMVYMPLFGPFLHRGPV